MKGKVMRKALAAALALLIVSDGVPIQPLSQVFEDIVVTASAETSTSTITVDGTDYTLYTGFTATAGTNASAAAHNYPKLVDGDLDASSSWHLNNDSSTDMSASAASGVTYAEYSWNGTVLEKTEKTITDYNVVTSSLKSLTSGTMS